MNKNKQNKIINKNQAEQDLDNIFLSKNLKSTLTKSLVLKIISIFFLFLLPVASAYLIDNYISTKAINWEAVYVFLIIIALILLTTYISAILFHKFQETFIKNLNQKIFNRIFTLPYNILEKKKKSFWFTLFRDIDYIMNNLTIHFYAKKFDYMFAALALGILSGILRLEGIILFIVLILTATIIEMLKGYMKYSLEKEKWVIKNRDDVISDTVYNISTTKSLSLEDKVKSLWLSYQSIIFDKTFRRNKINNLGHKIIFIISIVTFLALSFISSIKLLNGDLTIGQFGAVFLLFGMALYFIFKGHKDNMKFVKLSECMHRLSEVFLFIDRAHQRQMNKLTLASDATISDVLSFEDVTFTKDGKKVLENANISFDTGQMYVFEPDEENNPDKIFKAILGLYGIKSGKIKINSMALSNIKKENMGEFIRYVSDDNFILDGSIKDNLTCYIQNRKKGEDKDDSELLTLEDTYEMFNLDFIDSLGDALDTPIGNASLSNKQLRLINIARAFIGSPEIVLLNQPFKFLSAHEKNKVSEVLEKLSKNVLILMIGDPYEIQTENTIYLKLDNYNIVPTEKKAAKYKSTFTWKKSKLPSKINKDDRMAVSNIKGAIFKKIERKDNKNES